MVNTSAPVVHETLEYHFLAVVIPMRGHHLHVGQHAALILELGLMLFVDSAAQFQHLLVG